MMDSLESEQTDDSRSLFSIRRLNRSWTLVKSAVHKAKIVAFEVKMRTIFHLFVCFNNLLISSMQSHDDTITIICELHKCGG